MKIISRAPLRISYAGGGTDLEPFLSKFGGCVIASTINQYSYTIISPCQEWIFYSKDLNTKSIYKNLSDNLHLDDKNILLINTYLYFCKKFKIKKTPIKIITTSDVVPGSGLGGSSATVVCILSALLKYYNIHIDKIELSELAFHIERNISNMPGGKQDQYTSCFGGFKLFEFLKNKNIINDLNVDYQFKNTLEMSTLLYYAGMPRQNTVINENLDNLKNNPVSTQYTHLLKNNCISMKSAIENKNIRHMATIFNDNWEIKKQISKTITTEFLDEIYKVAMENGAIGGKICGAGGGGHLIFLVSIENRKKLINKLNSLAGSVIPFSFTNNGVESWKI